MNAINEYGTGEPQSSGRMNLQGQNKPKTIVDLAERVSDLEATWRKTDDIMDYASFMSEEKRLRLELSKWHADPVGYEDAEREKEIQRLEELDEKDEYIERGILSAPYLM